MTEDREPFLSRWSRIKTEARQAQGDAKAAPAAEEDAEPPAPAPGGPGAEAALPPIESLEGAASEYRGFMNPEVGDSLRRAALKKLFSDPHFNAIDPNEAYSGDFTQSEGIDAAMMKTIEHAKGLLFDEPPQAARESGESEGEGRRVQPGEAKEMQSLPEDPHEQGISGQVPSEDPAGSRSGRE